MNKNIVVKILFAAAIIFAMPMLNSCSKYSQNISETENSGKIALLKDNNPNFDLVVSNEIMKELNAKDPSVLESIEKYFNFISDENIDSNLISINTEKNSESVSVSDMSKKGGDNSVNSYDTIDTASDILIKNRVSKLRYKDYYIDASLGKISIVCGSVNAAVDALKYLNEEYIDKGVNQEGEFLIPEPKSGIHNGDYLKSSVAGVSIDQYSLVYLSNKQYCDGEKNAVYMRKYFEQNFGVKLDMNNSDYSKEINNKIVIGKTGLPISAEYYREKADICDYKIVQSDGNLYILGGSDWSVQYAIDYLIDTFFSKGKDIPEGYSYEGSVYGEYLFKKDDDLNLRIMTNNVWNNQNNNPIWLSQGEDCSAYTRFENMAKIFAAYNPDVLCFQEMDPSYVNVMINYLNSADRAYKLVSFREAGIAGSSYTPIIYNSNEVTLLDSGSHVFTYGSNQLTKSYTWGYFKQNSSGKCFAAFSTHLWWMNENDLPGSAEYRENQITEISEAIDELSEKYNCPCFVMGDFNCTASSKEYQILPKLGFSDCYDIATKFADNTSGTYNCSSFVFSCKPNGGSYKKTSIDHALAKNLNDSEVLIYEYVNPNFYGKLSDHAPLYIDVNLN